MAGSSDVNEGCHIHFGIFMMQVQRLCPSRTNETQCLAWQCVHKHAPNQDPPSEMQVLELNAAGRNVRVWQDGDLIKPIKLIQVVAQAP